jgi:tetratricopeptide (TPR) repeat protein/S1-C subfamily serine protease
MPSRLTPNMKITVLTALLLATNLLPAIAVAPEIDSRSERLRQRSLPAHRLADADLNNSNLTPQQIRTHSTRITVRIAAENNNGGSGVLIGKKAAKGAPGSTTYLILTNKHVIGKSTKFQIQTADGKQHTAQLVPKTQINPKYDVALLQFTSTQKYQLADLKYDTGTAMATNRQIYSAGFPFDSAQLRFTTGQVSQLSDVPLEDGTQIGYVTNKGEKNIRQGMSGGPVMAISGDKAVVIGINTIGAAPLIPSYTYFDGSKPNAKRAAEYTKSNWGIPIYNLLSQINPDILYQYDNLPKVQRQVSPTGYMAQLNRQTRQQTVRIEANGGNGSGVIVAKQGSTYYVLTAKHVVFDLYKTKQLYTDIKTITHEQESYPIQSTDITLAEGLDLAVVKFTSNANYPIAQLGNYNPPKDAIVFASGFPDRQRIDSPLWQWQLNPGKNVGDRESRKFQTQDKFSFESEGYDLIYTSISYGGMSGGGVFDTEGRVVGIHGKVEGDGGSKQQDWNKDLSFGNSLGISIQSFIGLATKLKVSPQLLKTSKNVARELNASELATVVAVRDSIPQPPADSSAKQWLQYGNQLHRIGKYADAVKAFDSAIAKSPGYQWAGYYGKARAFRSDNKYPQALAAISKAIATIPAEGRRTHYYMWQRQSDYYVELRKYNEAIKAIDMAIALEPTDILLFSSKAGVFNSAKKYQQAMSIYDKLIKDRPESYLFISRGYNKSEAGDKAAALLDFNKAISLDPNSARGYISRAMLSFIPGNMVKALPDFDKAISLDDRSESAYFGRANVKFLSGDLQGGLLDANKIIALDPKSHLGYLIRANIQSRLGDKQRALSDFDKAIALSPNKTYPLTSRASFRAKSGDKSGALADCDRAASIDPDDSEVYNSRAIVKVQFGDKQGAIADYNRAILLDPKSVMAYTGRGFMREELGDNRGALSDYDKAILSDPNLLSLPYYHRGDLKLKLDDPKGALPDYEKSISMDNAKATRGYIGRGNVKFKLGDKLGALADYEKAIALAPKEARGYVVRAKVKSQLGNKQGALLDYNTAISFTPEYKTYIARGLVKLELGDRQGSLADCDRAIAVAPKETLAYFIRSDIRSKLGDKSGELSDLDRAIALAPNDPNGYIIRGAVKFQSGNLKGALADYNKLIEIEPKKDSYYTSRSEIKLALGNKAGAISDCDRAIALNPKNDAAYFVRGSIKSKLDDRQGAVNDYDRAIGLNPNNYNAYLNRGNTKFELGDLTVAMSDTNRAIAINPKLAPAYSNRGFFTIINGSDRDAFTDLEMAIKLDPKLSDGYAIRGFAREIAGDKQNAIADYKQAVRLNPQIVSDWKKQSGLIKKSNSTAYQKYQQMIRQLEIGSRLN